MAPLDLDVLDPWSGEGWKWADNWKKDAEHSDTTATLGASGLKARGGAGGALKTVGFGFFDFCAFCALMVWLQLLCKCLSEAARKAYASSHLQASLSWMASSVEVLLPDEGLAKRCCLLGWAQGLAQWGAQRFGGALLSPEGALLGLVHPLQMVEGR